MLAYQIQNLMKTYPRQAQPANNQIMLDIQVGEVFGLFGANGAGKTTLIKQMVNLLKPDSGDIMLMGKPLNHSPRYTPGLVGYMPQSGQAFNSLTVGEALYFTAHLRGLSRRDARKERDRLVSFWDLDGLQDRVVSRLSGGQRRLALLATTMAASPPVLILDEPTNDLDPQHRQMVWDNLRQVNRENEHTIVLVTHNIIEAEKIVQRVGFMRAGRLVAVGRPGELKADLNQQLRLEIVFQPNGAPPTLPENAAPIVLAPGRWQMLIDRHEAPDYLEALNRADSLEDFRLSTATLEDLYLAMERDHAAIHRSTH